MGALYEASNISGVINGTGESASTAAASGAAYVFYRRGEPSVYIYQALEQADPTLSQPILFTVEFSKAIQPATFTTADITQTGTATGVTWSISNPSGDNKTFTLQATAGSNGTYVPTMSAGVVSDNDGFTNLASSTAFDNSVTYSSTGYIYITDATTTEGGTLNFIVSLSMTSGSNTTFTWSTIDQSATSSSDYSSIVSATGTIPAGQLTLGLTVITINDIEKESTETLLISLSNSNNQPIIDNIGVGQIADDDQCDPTGWCQQAYLKAAYPVSGDSFGYSSSISGDPIVVGAYIEDATNSGIINGTGESANTTSSDLGAA